MAAVLLVAVGIYVRQHSLVEQLARSTTPPAAVNVSGDVSDAAIAGLNDADLLQEVAQQSPAMHAQYSDNLQHGSTNTFRMEKSMVAADPNDQEARRSLMEAYQQKAMLFELAWTGLYLIIVAVIVFFCTIILDDDRRFAIECFAIE